MTTPRYFAAHDASGVTTLPAPSEAALVRALDAFVLGGPRAPKRVVVARDMSGDLFLVDEDDPDGLAESIRETVLHHEIAGSKARFVDVDHVWLFIAELLEHADGDAPGENDPVQLYGRLCGPFAGSMFAAGAVAQNGRLTITRGDLLRGFVEGAGHAFVLEGGVVLHAAVPADRPEEIAAGKGCVLCYPLLPMDAGDAGGNEAVSIQVLDGLLNALQQDLAKRGSSHAFAKQELPVLDRSALEARLVADGFVVNGDVAERRQGIFSMERRPLPRDGSVGEFLAAARAALPAIGGFPDARSQALWARIRAHASPAHFANATPPPPRPPQKALKEQPFRRTEPDWMSDFAAPASAKPAPRRTQLKPAPKPAQSPPKPKPGSTKGKPDWMKDFE